MYLKRRSIKRLMLLFSDNRSEKKLEEAYDKHTSRYAVKHAAWDKSKCDKHIS